MLHEGETESVAPPCAARDFADVGVAGLPPPILQENIEADPPVVGKLRLPGRLRESVGNVAG
eukprot:1176592-Lingulodinium_polyedra.AAC.1